MSLVASVRQGLPPRGWARRGGGVRHLTGRLGAATGRLAALAGYTASGNLSQLARAWEQLPPEEHAVGTEIILQNTLSNGLPSTLMALTTVAAVGVRDRIVVEADPVGEGAATRHRRFRAAGLDTVRQLYGVKHKVFEQRCRLLHPAYGRWVVEFMYGRVRSRPGPDQKTRALCEMAALGGQFVLPQFQGGLMSALTVGATLEEVRGVLDLVADVWGPEQQAMVDSLWSDVLLRRLASGGWSPARGPGAGDEEMHPDSFLRKDWSHLKAASAVDPPLWRHPIVASLRQVRGLPDQTRLIALLASHSAAGNLSGLTQDWQSLGASDHRPALEALLGTVATSGFHRLHNALRALSEQGICAEAIDVAAEDAVDADRFAATGETLMQLIYRNGFPWSRDSITKLHPDLWQWVLEFYHGQVLGRGSPRLSMADRHLALLGCLPGVATTQLGLLMTGALNCGASLDAVRGILDQNAVVWGRVSQSHVDGYWLSFARRRARQS
jgi:alkylhydroperoxidase/carboxymuconolactone decarboxylase family protein YurZ